MDHSAGVRRDRRCGHEVTREGTLIDAHHGSRRGHDRKSLRGVAKRGGDGVEGGRRKWRAKGLLWRDVMGGGTWEHEVVINDMGGDQKNHPCGVIISNLINASFKPCTLSPYIYPHTITLYGNGYLVSLPLMQSLTD